MRTIPAALITLLVMACSGCYTIKYRIENRQGGTFQNEYTNIFFLWGLAPGQKPINEKLVCQGNKLILAESSMRAANVLDTILSAGLTGTSTVKTVCAGDPARNSASNSKTSDSKKGGAASY